MRWLCFCLSSVIVLGLGCAREKVRNGNTPKPVPVPPPVSVKGTNSLLVTPGGQISGRVVMVSLEGRYVVATFPLGTMPVANTRLNVYRGGLKVGEIKITGPVRDVNVVADIVAGECRSGDEIKSD